METRGPVLATTHQNAWQSVGAIFIRIWSNDRKPNSYRYIRGLRNENDGRAPSRAGDGRTISGYFARAGDRMRKVEGKLRRRAARRVAA